MTSTCPAAAFTTSLSAAKAKATTSSRGRWHRVHRVNFNFSTLRKVVPTVCPTHHACARVVAARPFARPKQPMISRPSSPTNGTYFQFLSRSLEIHTGVSLFDHSLRFTAPRPFTGTIGKKVGTSHGLPWQKISRDRLAEVLPTEDDKFFREHLE